MLKHSKKQKGQGMVEYIVIVALVGLGSIAAYSFFGQSVRGQTAQMADQIAGANVKTGQTDATTAAGSATTEATSQINLKTYDANGNGA